MLTTTATRRRARRPFRRLANNTERRCAIGVTVENCNIRAHRTTSGSAPDYHLIAHHGDAGLDTESPGFDPTEYATIKAAAAQSQSAFDSACATVLGTWYTARTSGFKSTIRTIIAGL